MTENEGDMIEKEFEKKVKKVKWWVLVFQWWIRISFSFELDEQRSFHGDVEIVVGVIVEDEGFFHIFSLAFLINKDHSVQILYHEFIVVIEVPFELKSAVQGIRTIEINVSEKLFLSNSFFYGSILFDFFGDSKDEPAGLGSAQSWDFD